MLTVYQSDVFEMSLPRNSIDLVIASPSRYILRDYLEELFRWIDWCISPKGVVVIDMPGLYNEHKQILHRYNNDLIEKRITGLSLKYRYCLALHGLYLVDELMTAYFYSVGDIERYNKIPYRKCTERPMRHRCESDTVYVQSLIERFTKAGDTVLDPFCGTGTVPRVAHRLGREAIGIDRRCPFTNELPLKGEI